MIDINLWNVVEKCTEERTCGGGTRPSLSSRAPGSLLRRSSAGLLRVHGSGRGGRSRLAGARRVRLGHPVRRVLSLPHLPGGETEAQGLSTLVLADGSSAVEAVRETYPTPLPLAIRHLQRQGPSAAPTSPCGFKRAPWVLLAW